MYWTNKFLILLCITALSSSISTAENISIKVDSNRKDVFLEESFDLTVRVSGTTKNIRPDLSALRDCEIKPLGFKNQSHRSYIIINGKAIDKSVKGWAHYYRITPSSPGKFTAGPVTIRIAGRTLKAEGPKINVIGMEKDESVFLSITTSKDSVIVDEPFDITISVALKRMKGRYARLDPLNPADPPRIFSPHLYPMHADGLDGPEMHKVLAEFLVRRPNSPGFRINKYTIDQGPLATFLISDDHRIEQPAKIMFPRTEKNYGTSDYFKYSLKLRYTPRREGSYIFGPTTFKGRIVRDILPSGQIASKPIYVAGNAVTVKVVPPPEANRPYSYMGAIGTKMIAEATLDTQTCKISDPLTLTLSISGNINLENIIPPRLSKQPSLHEKFRIYDETTETSGIEGSKIYRYIIRPTTTGTQEFPPIKLSYYDTKDLTYKTVTTEAIPIRVNETTRVIVETILNTSTNGSDSAKSDISSNIIQPAPISMNTSGFIHKPLQISREHIMIITMGPTIYILLLSITYLRRKTSRDPQKELSRNALRNAERILSSNEPDCIRRSMINFLADRLSRNASGMTPSDVENILKEKGVANELSSRYQTALQESFNSIYSETQMEKSHSRQEAKEIKKLIADMDQAIPHRDTKNKTNSSYMLIALAVGVLSITMPQTCTANTEELKREFIWTQALSQTQSANTEKDFIEAASVYSGLIEDGAINGHLFFNAATAYLMAGKHEKAMDNLIRAERHLGATWAVRRNMIMAMNAANPPEEPASLPWSRSLFFWHFSLAGETRMNTTIISFFAIWIGLAIAHLGLKKIGKTISILALITFILFGSSTADSMYREAQAREQLQTANAEERE